MVFRNLTNSHALRAWLPSVDIFSFLFSFSFSFSPSDGREDFDVQCPMVIEKEKKKRKEKDLRTRDWCLAHAHTYSRFNPLDVDRECERGSSSRLSFSRMLERKRIEDQHAKRRKDPEQPTPHQRLKASHGCSGRTCSRFSLVWCSLREQAEGPRPALPSVAFRLQLFLPFSPFPFSLGQKTFQH